MTHYLNDTEANGNKFRQRFDKDTPNRNDGGLYLHKHDMTLVVTLLRARSRWPLSTGAGLVQACEPARKGKAAARASETRRLRAWAPDRSSYSMRVVVFWCRRSFCTTFEKRRKGELGEAGLPKKRQCMA